MEPKYLLTFTLAKHGVIKMCTRALKVEKMATIVKRKFLNEKNAKSFRYVTGVLNRGITNDVRGHFR